MACQRWRHVTTGFSVKPIARQVRARLALQHATHEQDHVDGGKLAPGEDGPAIQVVNPLTPVTAPDGQAAPTIDAKEAGVGARRVAVGALQPVWMEVLLQPDDALLIIEEVDNWKVHTLILPGLHYLYS